VIGLEEPRNGLERAKKSKAGLYCENRVGQGFGKNDGSVRKGDLVQHSLL